MFILTFQSYSKLPSQRHVFYSQVLETLFNSHDSLSKLGYEREKESGLNREEFNTVLNTFSFLTIFENKLIFNKTYFRNKSNQIKKKFPDLRFGNDKILNDLLISLCILNKEGFDYSFVHKSIQEYFAAEYVAGLSEVNKKKVYKKLYKLFLSDNGEINISYVNFISLLIELDYKSVHEFLIFDFFDYLIKGLRIIEKFPDDKKLTSKNEKFVFSHIFMLNQIFKDLFEFKEQNRIRKSYGNIYSHVKMKTVNKDGGKLSIKIDFDEKYTTGLEKLLNEERLRIKNIIKQRNNSEDGILELL